MNSLRLQLSILGLAALLLLGCKKEEVNSTLSPGIIEDQTFNTTVLIDGHEYDGSIIRNCVFEDIEGDGLQIRDVDQLCIEDCIFRDISGDAIRFRNSGTSDGVKIINNEIHDIKKNGILAPEDHINTLIQGTRFIRWQPAILPANLGLRTTAFISRGST